MRIRYLARETKAVALVFYGKSGCGVHIHYDIINSSRKVHLFYI